MGGARSDGWRSAERGRMRCEAVRGQAARRRGNATRAAPSTRGCGPSRRSVARSAGEEKRALDLLDRLRHVDATGAGGGAVEGGGAAPHALRVVDALQELGCALVTPAEE